jgi:acetylcholinesterase
MTTHLVNFVVGLNPNGGNLLFWPKYTAANPVLMTYIDPPLSNPLLTPLLQLSNDTYRELAMQELTKLFLAHPL